MSHHASPPRFRPDPMGSLLWLFAKYANSGLATSQSQRRQPRPVRRTSQFSPVTSAAMLLRSSSRCHGRGRHFLLLGLALFALFEGGCSDGDAVSSLLESAAVGSGGSAAGTETTVSTDSTQGSSGSPGSTSGAAGGSGGASPDGGADEQTAVSGAGGGA